MSSKEKSPAYQMYPKDFDTDEAVKLMTLEEIGAYVKLEPSPGRCVHRDPRHKNMVKKRRKPRVHRELARVDSELKI